MPYPNYQPYQPTMTQFTMGNQQPYQMSNTYSQMPGQSPLMNPSSGIIWVQGEIGARAYPVGAGNSVLLMDSDDKYFYIKSADMSGMPKLHKYYYSEVVDEVPKIESHDTEKYDTAKLASREEVKELQNQIQELQEQLKSVEAIKTSSRRGGKQDG